MCERAIDTIKKGGFTAEIHYDQDAQNPREDFDPFGHIVAWHRRYSLGDKDQKFKTRGEWLYSLLKELDLLETVELPSHILEDDSDYEKIDLLCDELYQDDRESVDAAFKALEDHAVILDVYMYEHSGIALQTSPFRDPWDSGQVGYIYATRPEVEKEFGPWSEEARKKAEALLKSEVETFGMYVNGEVYGYIVTDPEGEEVDSCWGFIGYQHVEEEVGQVLNYYLNKETA